MAEIEVTIPTVQYGKVKVRATLEEFGFRLDEPSAFGYALAIYKASFTLGFRDGSQVDVMAPLGPSQGGLPGNPQDDGLSQERAIQALSDGLGGAAVLTETDADGAEEEYGSAAETKEATQARTADAPWNAKVDAKPKPWETDVTAPAVLDAAW